MQVSRIQVENIFKILPTGYYVGRQVKNVLTDEQSSYYDLMNDEIHVSYPMIEKVSKSLPDSLTIENDIRCLLYHEVSHALLTSNKLSITAQTNIFEDERIETVLGNYYRGVDFKQFVKRVNNFQNEKPKTADEMYYQIVRYRVGPQQFVERVSSIINDYAQITRRSNWQIVYDYEHAIDILYIDIVKYFNEQKQNENNSNSSNSQNDEGEDGQQECCSSSGSSNGEQSEKSDSKKEANSASDDNDNSITLSNEQIKSLIDSVVSQYDSIDYRQKIDQILSNVKHTAKQTASAINAYSGIFNPRSVVRKDYKWFVQQNRTGHVKAFSKIKLNLFIDCSGSFKWNDEKVNMLLKALIAFEKQNKDFSFDLISCGSGQKLRAKNDRIQISHGGTCITDSIFEQFKQVQQADAQNINICLYDGYCVATAFDCHKAQYEKNLSAFNNNRSVLILDYSNKDVAEKYCKNAKVIITDNYTEELDKNVFDALQALTR